MSIPDTWVDHHLLLNSMSVLRNRMAASTGDPVTLLDAISGYLSTGLYVEKRQSAARVSWLLDWVECLAQVRNSVDPQGATCEVTVAPGGDDDRMAHLGHARDMVLALFSAAPGQAPGRPCKVELRLAGDRLRLDVVGAGDNLRARWEDLANACPAHALRLEPSGRAGALACSAWLPPAD
jgi:hypothetical protein